jgi:endoglucanase
MPTSLVLQDDQDAVDGIHRSVAKQLIIAPGNGYTGGHAWLQSSQGGEPSGDYLYKLHDPLGNTAIDIHEYLNVDFSGGHAVCRQNAPYNLDPLTGWLRKRHLKARKYNFDEPK